MPSIVNRDGVEVTDLRAESLNPVRTIRLYREAVVGPCLVWDASVAGLLATQFLRSLGFTGRQIAETRGAMPASERSACRMIAEAPDAASQPALVVQKLVQIAAAPHPRLARAA